MDEDVFRWVTDLLLLAILVVSLMHLARLAARDKVRGRTGYGQASGHGTDRDPRRGT